MLTGIERCYTRVGFNIIRLKMCLSQTLQPIFSDEENKFYGIVTRGQEASGGLVKSVSGQADADADADASRDKSYKTFFVGNLQLFVIN